MKDGRRLPNRLIVVAMAPVLVFMLLYTTVTLATVGRSVSSVLRNRYDESLSFVAERSLEICDEGFEQLLELRLEEDTRMIDAVKNDSLARIIQLAERHTPVELFVFDSNEVLIATSTHARGSGVDGTGLSPTGVSPPGGEVFEIGQRSYKASSVRFPFFGWEIVAGIDVVQYAAVQRAGFRSILVIVLGGFVLTLGVISASFAYFIRRPARLLIEASGQVDVCRFEKVALDRSDEMGVLATAFNEMVAGLESQRGEVDRLLSELRRAEERFRQAFLASPDASIITSYDSGRIVEVNAGFESLTGVSSDAAEGRVLDDLGLLPEETIDRVAGEIAGYGRAQNVPAIVHRPDGAERQVLLSSRPAVIDGGSVVLSVVRDVTELFEANERSRELEEQLRQSQKMEAIGKLAGGVAHDFNNLLTGILGYVDLLRESASPAGAAKDSLDEIENAAMRGAELTQRLLAFGRKQLLRPSLVKVNEVVDGLEGLLATLLGEQYTVERMGDRALGPIRIDRSQLEQVIVNLAVNARDAMPEGGALTIGVERTNDAPDGDGGSLPGVHLYVRDTGGGMTEEVASHAFEPFFTTKEPGKGTGLGLSMVYGVVAQSGGDVWVESAEAVGTTVHMVFPFADGLKRPSDGSPTVATPDSE